MEETLQEFKEIFENIKYKNFEAVKRGNASVGITFEKIINKKEDHSYLPDFKGIEIKCKNFNSKSPITLLNITPKCIIHEYASLYLLNNYGKTTNTNIFSKKFNIKCSNRPKEYNNYIFKLDINKVQEKIFLNIYDNNNKLIDNSVYWNFEDIKERVLIKLNYIALIIANSNIKHGIKYYRYIKLRLYKFKSFKTFIELIENNYIYIEFYILTNTNPYDNRKFIDHGIAFRMYNTYMNKLFDEI